MLRSLVIFLVGAVLGTAFGVALGFFLFPYIFPPPPAAEQLTTTDRATTLLAQGTFIHANPSDPIHYGRGKVTVFQDLLHLESDFEVGPGPKFHVYLVPEANVTPSTRVAQTRYVDLGRLKAFKGSQNYPVPSGIDPARYQSVVIWCEQFGVLISPAALKLQ